MDRRGNVPPPAPDSLCARAWEARAAYARDGVRHSAHEVQAQLLKKLVEARQRILKQLASGS